MLSLGILTPWLHCTSPGAAPVLTSHHISGDATVESDVRFGYVLQHPFLLVLTLPLIPVEMPELQKCNKNPSVPF